MVVVFMVIRNFFEKTGWYICPAYKECVYDVCHAHIKHSHDAGQISEVHTGECAPFLLGKYGSFVKALHTNQTNGCIQRRMIEIPYETT